jgi:hypothetical protein
MIFWGYSRQEDLSAPQKFPCLYNVPSISQRTEEWRVKWNSRVSSITVIHLNTAVHTRDFMQLRIRLFVFANWHINPGLSENSMPSRHIKAGEITTRWTYYQKQEYGSDLSTQYRYFLLVYWDGLWLLGKNRTYPYPYSVLFYFSLGLFLTAEVFLNHSGFLDHIR